MSKISDFVQKNTKYMLLGIGIPFVLYFLMIWNHQFIPFPLYLQLRRISHWVLVFLGLSFFPIALLSNNKWGIKILLVLGILPICCFFGLAFAFDSYEILDTTTLNDQTFHLVYWYENYDNAFSCSLYQCDKKGVNCKPIDSSIHYDCYSSHGRESELIVDPLNNEIHVQYTISGGHDYLVYSFGNPSREYDHTTLIESENHYYLGYVEIESDDGVSWNGLFYQCEQDHSTCDRLPFEYFDVHLNDLDLEYDEKTDLFSIYEDDTLTYTYDGETGTCHVDECSLVN